MNQEQLVSWWCDLNCWRWPCDLPLPQGWDAMTVSEREAEIMSAWDVVHRLSNAFGLHPAIMTIWTQRIDAGKPCYDPRSRALNEPAARTA